MEICNKDKTKNIFYIDINIKKKTLKMFHVKHFQLMIIGGTYYYINKIAHNLKASEQNLYAYLSN